MRCRPFLMLAMTLALVVGCHRGHPRRKSRSGAMAIPSTASAAKLIIGQWKIEGFVGTTAAGSTKAKALNDQLAGSLGSAEIITEITGRDIVSHAGISKQMIGYTIKEDGRARCVLLSGDDDVVIELEDLDHMTMNRVGNAIEAKMRLVRVHPSAAVAPPSASSVSPHVH